MSQKHHLKVIFFLTFAVLAACGKTETEQASSKVEHSVTPPPPPMQAESYLKN